ncbi:N-acetyltransferase [uncultured Tessaracoccus sp.]|uniref:GNAT family N-acetyltransferase n=1 Tax=uncultured Tessaracoccus sp. TaxID=905023 RepID=UPI00260C6497|nr:GNAT family N-acetyltransferase [uncultured Tessaracoccus sp.]
MGITVTDGRRTEIEAYVNLLVEAFVDDPLVAQQAGPHPEAGLRAQFTAMIDAVYLEAGAVDVARDGDEVVGVALWLAPKGRRRQGLARRLRLLLAHVPALVRALPPARRLPRLVSATRALAAAVPSVPHWHLMDIAVDAGHRGKNIGGRLLEHGLGRVDADQAPAYLEASTPRVAALYRRHGFGTIQVLQIGDVPVHAMLRPVQERL